jgi:hypothetical protein
MSRRIGLRLGGVLLILLAGFGAWRATHATSGSVSGFHVVDGYWLGPETACSDANAPDYCLAAVATATLDLEAQGSHTQIVRAVIAPQSCDATTYVFCANGGMKTATLFVVFDLADGTRQTVGLLCQGAVTDGSLIVAPNCRPDHIHNQENVSEEAPSS